MARKTVLVTGASGLVGQAAIKYFAATGCDVIAVSRRAPDDLHGARFVSLDLSDAAKCTDLFSGMSGVTHLVYAALYEQPGLVAGWRESEQIAINERMLRNVLTPLQKAAAGLRHVALLQGTKAYGVHVRPIPIPAREGRDEARDIPNFYWAQEDYLRAQQAGKDWHFSILRPVLVVGQSVGSAMNVIPAIGAWAALMKEDGWRELPFPGGAARVAQAVDADLLAGAIGWTGEADNARNEAFNVTNGDAFTWPNVWPAIAGALGMKAGANEQISLKASLAARSADWSHLASRHGLRHCDLEAFVGLSLEYADYQMGHGRTASPPPSIVSTIKLHSGGFHQVMDTEAMFAKWFRVFQEKRLLPPL